ncbi:MAG: peptide ABC transporter substrate-binding protein, partial [Chitinophagaceae bacterium]|nr:peptide ABC transporter substrate-binding protein [Rubrivivax sp.]
VRQLAGLGLGGPVAGMLLLHAGVAPAQSAASANKATRRGGGGLLKLLWWQGPTQLNPHFATGTKDQDGARLFYEPLADWDADGNLVPILAAELPTLANGAVARDGRSVVWKLKQGVLWHDGRPCTADDLVFTWEYARNPDTAAVSAGFFNPVQVQKIDSHSVRIVFKDPTPFWAGAFVGAGGNVLPRHLFAPYIGARSRDAPVNLKPVGTGPYRFVEFKPGDMLRGELNPNYHVPNRPFFDSIEMKGGGDAVSAARAVIQTGEYDFAWNLQIEDDVLKRMESGGKGRAVYAAGGDVEYMQFNFADPNTEVDGERSNPKTRHPLLGDPAVRQALALLLDRANIQAFIYGRAGKATANFINNPARFVSPNNRWEFSVDKANAVLEAAGWRRAAGNAGAADGVRSKGGKPLKLLFQTSTNALRQKTQALVKQAAAKAGIEVEIKAVAGSVFFSTDLGNPDTYGKFYADIQMFTTSGTIDPERLMLRFASWEIASKANKWSGLNLNRWRNDDYDATYRAAKVELDPVKRAALFIRMNDLVIQNHAVVPVAHRQTVAAVANKLVAPLSGWANDTWLLHEWFREA